MKDDEQVRLRKEKSQGRFLFLTQDITVYFLSTPWKKPIGSSSIIFYKDYIRFQSKSQASSSVVTALYAQFLSSLMDWYLLHYAFDMIIE